MHNSPSFYISGHLADAFMKSDLHQQQFGVQYLAQGHYDMQTSVVFRYPYFPYLLYLV